MSNKQQGVLYFGSYDPEYSRNRIFKKGLTKNKLKVFEARASGLFPARYLKLILQFLKYKDRVGSIIIGFPGHYDVPLAFFLGKLFGKKTFYDIFTSMFETYVLDREVVKKGSLRSSFFYFIDWLGLKLADYVIIDTLAHGKFYSSLYSLSLKKQILVYVGSDTDYFFPRKLKEETDVLFYGSYQPLQGADVIVKAASLLPKVKFKMIGEGQTIKSAENLAKKLQVKNVEFVNWLPIKKLAEEISRAKITLGIFGTSQKTSVVIPNKVYDYLASGKLVITANTDAAKELLADGVNVILIPANNSKALADVINSLFKNPEKRLKIAQNGYSFFVKNLKADLIAKSLIVKIDER